MSNFCEFVDGDMTEEDRKKIDELLIKIAEENELPGKIGKFGRKSPTSENLSDFQRARCRFVEKVVRGEKR